MDHSPLNALRNRKLFYIISYGLVFLMMLCVVLTLGALIQRVLPHWRSGIIAGVLLFIVLDRLYTHRHLKSLTLFSSEWAVTVGAQWALIVLVTRFLLSYASGLYAFLADLSRFSRGDLAGLFTGEFVITLLLSLLLWWLPGQFLELLDEIGLDEELALREEAPPLQTDVVPAHQRLVTLIFSLGMGLVVLTVLTRINVREILSNTAGLPDVRVSPFSGAEASALLYFVFGLTLLSLSRLMSLQTHWNRLRIPISSQNLARQWGIYSLLFLLILAVIVSLLPAGDSLGLFSVLGSMFRFLLAVLVFISQLLLSVLLLLFTLPFMLFGQPSPFLNELPPPPPLPTLPVPPASPPANNELWRVVRSILLWGSLLLVLFFSIRHVLRQHDGVLAALRRSRVANWLALVWHWLSRNAENAQGALSRAITQGWQSILARRDGGRISSPARWLRLRSLDPRRQVYFFYLAMVRRGAEQGLERKPSQTPAEYADTLQQGIPDAGEDIASMTEAFMEARYSRREVDSQAAGLVKEMWGRIRQAFQAKLKRERSVNQ